MSCLNEYVTHSENEDTIYYGGNMCLEDSFCYSFVPVEERFGFPYTTYMNTTWHGWE